MTDYYVELDTKVVNGSGYTSADRIIIRAGTRDGLKFENFNGNGQYITIMNEKTTSSTKVEINGMSGFGCLSISNCKYIDLRGDNDVGLEYGIKVINDNTSQSAGSVWVYGESDHIKLSYLEVTCEGSTVISGNGIFIQDGNLSAAWTFDTIEIHHNYIHNTRYAGMYLGHNDPPSYDSPYIARVTVHDNILKDLGTYGMVQKGHNGGPNSYYNNFIDTTGVVSRPDIPSDSFRTGIRVRTYTHSYSVDVYDNTIFNTIGPGILAGRGSHNIYNNIICGAGTGNDANWAHGIKLFLMTNGTNVYDNIIIQPTQYGIYADGNVSNCVDSRNLIGDAGLGERFVKSGGIMTEGTGADANIYHADVADFGFNSWSDDGDYNNDDFSLDIDPCEDVVCPNVCIGVDLYSQVCDPTTGNCVPDQLIESNSAVCDYDPCEDVVCDDFCDGTTRYYNGVCDPVTGECLYDIEANSEICGYVPPEEPPETSIITYVIIGGVSLAILALSARN